MMDSRIKYPTSGTSALNPHVDQESSCTPIIDFYDYANASSCSQSSTNSAMETFKHKISYCIKTDELMQDFWLPERPETRLSSDTRLIFLATAALFVPIAIGILAFF